MFADSINHQSKDGHRSQFIIIYDKGDRDFNLMMLITSMGEEEHVMKTDRIVSLCDCIVYDYETNSNTNSNITDIEKRGS